jgi:microcystin degradation protein MlrC
LLFRTLDGEVTPTMAVSKPGLVVPSPFSATTVPPARDVVTRALAWEVQPELHDVTKWDRREDVLDVSFFFGFAWADVPQVGVSAVAITDDDPALAADIADDLADFAWERRVDFTDPDSLYDVEAAVSRAIDRSETADRPVLLLDHADRLSETTYVLRELLEQGATNAAYPLLWDPEAVAECADAGEGAEVTLAVGSKTSSRGGGPVDVTGTVEWVGENPYISTGPMLGGQRVDNGTTAILDVDGVWIQLTEEMNTEMVDTDPIEQYGYDAASFDVIVSKSKTHFRAVYEDFASEIIIADAPEYSPADLSVFDYRNVEDGVYPITEIEE